MFCASFAGAPAVQSSAPQEKPIDAVAFCHSGVPAASMIGKRLTPQVRTALQSCVVRVSFRYLAFVYMKEGHEIACHL